MGANPLFDFAILQGNLARGSPYEAGHLITFAGDELISNFDFPGTRSPGAQVYRRSFEVHPPSRFYFDAVAVDPDDCLQLRQALFKLPNPGFEVYCLFARKLPYAR